MQLMSAAGAQGMLWAFCAVMGLSMASIFLVFTGTSIARTFFIAAAMFGATGLYGYTTKRSIEVRLFPDHGPDRRRDRKPADLNPIEMPFSKVKAFLRKFSERTIRGLCKRIGSFVPTAAPVSQLLQACRLCIHMIGICSNLAGTPLLAR
jgi:hypothetical protein